MFHAAGLTPATLSKALNSFRGVELTSEDLVDLAQANWECVIGIWDLGNIPPRNVYSSYNSLLPFYI
jgi:hypothetical protein